MGERTDKARAFIEANAASPVVEGRLVGGRGEGAYLYLENGRRFRLTAEECKQVAPIHWKDHPHD